MWPHGLQHPRPPYPSPTPGVYSNSCPLSPWCHPTISSSIVPFSSCLQSFPTSGSFPVSHLFTSGGQSMLDLLAVQGTLMSLLQHQNSKASTLWRSAFFIVQHSYPYMTTGKTIALTRQTFCWQGNVSAFYMLGPNKCKIESRSLIWILVLVKGWSICLNIIHVISRFYASLLITLKYVHAFVCVLVPEFCSKLRNTGQNKHVVWVEQREKTKRLTQIKGNRPRNKFIVSAYFTQRLFKKNIFEINLVAVIY